VCLSVVYSECPKYNNVFISQQSVTPNATLVEELVQLLTRAPVLILMKVKYAMEVSTHKHIFFSRGKKTSSNLIC